MDDAAIGLDLDFEDFAVFRAGERLEGQAAARAASLVAGQFDDLLDDGEVGVIATLRSGLARLLAARSGRGRLGRIACRGSIGTTGGGGFALLAVESVFEVTDAGLEFLVVLSEQAFAFFGLGVHGVPVGRETEGLELLGETRANRAGPGRVGRSGANGQRRRRRGGRRDVDTNDGDSFGRETVDARGKILSHEPRCSPTRATRPDGRTGLPNAYAILARSVSEVTTFPRLRFGLVCQIAPRGVYRKILDTH